MIQLTRLNHQDLILNCDLIKFIEHAHDTVVTLINGEKLTVVEAPAEILRRITSYRREQAETLASVRPVLVPPVSSPEAEGD